MADGLFTTYFDYHCRKKNHRYLWCLYDILEILNIESKFCSLKLIAEEPQSLWAETKHFSVLFSSFYKPRLATSIEKRCGRNKGHAVWCEHGCRPITRRRTINSQNYFRSVCIAQILKRAKVWNSQYNVSEINKSFCRGPFASNWPRINGSKPVEFHEPLFMKLLTIRRIKGTKKK